MDAQQVVEAFPGEPTPTYVLRDRDGVYSEESQRRVAGLGSAQSLTAPRSPWQTPDAERLIGIVRRACPGQVIVFSEGHLRRLLAKYLRYYNRDPYYPTSLWA
jgi:hypothetical protein